VRESDVNNKNEFGGDRQPPADSPRLHHLVTAKITTMSSDPGLARLLKLLEDSNRFPPSARLPAARDLAAELRLSHTTICQLFIELERMGVVRRGSQRVRYLVPVRSRPTKRGLVRAAVITGSPPETLQPTAGIFNFVAEVHRTVQRELLAQGMEVTSVSGRDDSLHHLSKVDVAIVLEDAIDLLPKVRESRWARHVVVQGDCLEAAHLAGIDAVVSDHAHGCTKLVELLVARGCRRILRLWTHNADIAPWWFTARELGYREAVRAAGLSELPAIHLSYAAKVVELVPHVAGFDLSVHLLTGALIECMRQRDRPDALLVNTDSVVPSAYAAIRRLGLVPGRDVLVAGYDDYWCLREEAARESTPPVASVNKDGPAIGQALAMMVAHRLDRPESPPMRTQVLPRLVTTVQPRRTRKRIM